MKVANKSNVVAITGAGGFIGKYLVRALSERGNTSLRVLVRKPSDNKKLPSNVTEIVGDLCSPETLKDFLTPGCTVINLAYSFSAGSDHNIVMIKNLANACKYSKIKRMIHCSTASVYGRVKENIVNEESECNPRSNYGKTKLIIEEMLYAGSRGNYEYVNVRPTAIYGLEGLALIKLIKELVNGNMMKNYARACLFGRRTMNLVNIYNVIAAIIFLMEQYKDIDGETFIISEDDNPDNNYNYVESYFLRRLTNRQYLIPPLPLPQAILSVLLRILGRDSVNPSLIYSPDKLIQTGYEYKVSFGSGLDEIAEWYQQQAGY